MKTIYRKHIPLKGYKAITLYPFIIVRKESRDRFTAIDERHENIHGRQQKEMLIVGFYLWYAIEYLIRLCLSRSHSKAYRAISFEREAYANQSNSKYLKERRHFAWLSYL